MVPEDGHIVEERYGSGKVARRYHFFEGKLHRDNGPAVEWFFGNGNRQFNIWYHHGRYHRTDGPAVELFNLPGKRTSAKYWLDGKQVTKAEHRRLTALQKLSARASGADVFSL